MKKLLIIALCLFIVAACGNKKKVKMSKEYTTTDDIK